MMLGMVHADDLSEAERRVWDAFPTGKLVEFGTGRAEDDDPAGGEGRGPDRQVRAEVLAALLSGVMQAEPGQAAGVYLQGARVIGKLGVPGATFQHRLRLSKCYIPEGIDLSEANIQTLDLRGCHVGAIHLFGAKINGALNLGSAHLDGKDGPALAADRIRVSEDVFLDEGFTTSGAVGLHNANIAGHLYCSGASLTADAQGDALAADKLTVGGDVFLDEGFTASGAISFASAHIGDSVYLMPAQLGSVTAFDAAGARIEGVLRWAPAVQVFGQVNLAGTTVSQLEDDWSSGRPNGYWPTGAKLRLDGFVYERFGGNQQAEVYDRVSWIRSQYQRSAAGWMGFVPQPYEQLAAVYRRAGQDTQASTVAVARLRDLRRFGDLLTSRKFGNWVLDITICYGYKNWRAAVLMLLGYMIVLLVLGYAVAHNLIVPVITSQEPAPIATQCTSSYPCFFAIGYAFDVVVPLINLHQAEFWRIDGADLLGSWLIVLTWVATVFGWIGATFLVTGLSALGRRQ
jgi:hypothetical protein